MKTIIIVTVLGYYLLIVIFRSLLLKWKNGKSAFQLSFDDSLHGYNSRLFIYLALVTPAILILYVFLPKFYLLTNPFNWGKYQKAITLIGVSFSLISMIWTFIAQLQMKDSWRIGIDKTETTALRTSGIFSISRNPIFLGIIIANVGVFLMLPNAITLVQVFLSAHSIQTQIYLEEKYLEKIHTKAYSNYKTSVKRWLGKRAMK